MVITLDMQKQQMWIIISVLCTCRKFINSRHLFEQLNGLLLFSLLLSLYLLLSI